MSGRTGHSGKKQRQRQNDMEAVLRVEEVLFCMEELGNYVTDIFCACAVRSHTIDQLTSSRGRGREARKGNEVEPTKTLPIVVGPVFRPLQFAPTLHVQQKEMRVTCRRFYSSAVNTVSHTQLFETCISLCHDHRLGYPTARTMLPLPRISLVQRS